MSGTVNPATATNPAIPQPAGRAQPPPLQPAGPPYPNVWIDQPTQANQAPRWITWFDPQTGEPVAYFPGMTQSASHCLPTTEPANPVTGSCWIDESGPRLNVWAGGAWVGTDLT